MRRGLGVVAVTVLALGVMAAPAFADDHNLKGTFTLLKLSDTGFGTTVRECHGYDLGDGYDDIDRGTQVRVRNADDKTIAVGALGRGKQVDGNCRWTFSVKVPDSDF